MQGSRSRGRDTCASKHVSSMPSTVGVVSIRKDGWVGSGCRKCACFELQKSVAQPKLPVHYSWAACAPFLMLLSSLSHGAGKSCRKELQGRPN